MSVMRNDETLYFAYYKFVLEKDEQNGNAAD